MSIATILSKLAAGARLSAAEAAILTEARAAATEQKMLQAMYRGYAGEPEATAASQFFLTPQPKVADFYAAKRSQQTGKPGHVDRVLVDPEDAGETYGHSTISLPELGFKDPMYTTARRKVSPEQIKTREQLYAKGGSVNKSEIQRIHDRYMKAEQPTPNQEQMTHKPSARSANPVTQLARGWAAGTAGLPGDVEGLARMLIKYGATPGSYVDRNMDEEPTLPTSDFYKEWLPGRDTGIGGAEMENLGSLAGGAGATLPAKYGIRAAKVAARNAAAPTYGTADEINSVINRLDKAKGFAHGGLVQSPNTYDPARVDALVAQLQEEMYA